MSKKLLCITLASLTLAGIANISAATWKIKNSLGRDVCVTVNTGFTQIRRHIPNGSEVPVKSKLCLYSVSIKEGEGHAGMEKGRCPKDLPNIAKITIKDILDYSISMLTKKGATIYAADDRTKAAMKAAEAEVNRAKKLCKDMNFEVINENGKPKIKVLEIKPVAAPTESPTPPPAPPVMPTQEKNEVPPAPPVIDLTQKPSTSTQPTSSRADLLKQIREGKTLKGTSGTKTISTFSSY